MKNRYKRWIKRLLALLFVVVMISTVGFNMSDYQQDHSDSKKEEVHQKHDESESHAEEGEHEGGMEPLFFVIMALFIGTGTRHLLQKSPLPYTVTLLIIGLGLGAVTRLGFLESVGLGHWHVDFNFFIRSVDWAGDIDPHLILYVFLPTLIFEAAFAMDVHTFRKSIGNATLLAVPGIIVALILTAALAMLMKAFGIGLTTWNWTIALMFGTIVSATDPVAVVSLLKDLGASKKLRTLIESESLLNDGTAIVIFMVLLLGLTGAGNDGSPILEFVRVVFGGILVGVIIGFVIINWIKKVFNDALFEITVIIGAAYLTFYVAENFFHVSGVLGLVTLGLLIGGIGRTRISPEVGHFLHEFWELAAFIANTLIFIIVGVVIAKQTVFTINDFWILLIVYVGIHIIRAIVIGALFPLMRKVGYGVSVKDSYVLWWGGLRGAIGLALALIVAGEEQIAPEIRNQVLFLTAGIVILTSIINATTAKYLVRALGLTKISCAKALMIQDAHDYIKQSTENAIDRMKENRYMSGANWAEVSHYIPKEIHLDEEEALEKVNTLAEKRRRVLEKEKSNYWKQFEEGLLGPVAVQRLTDSIDHMLDEGGVVSLASREDLEYLWKTPRILNRLQNVPVIGKIAQRMFFEKLTLSYDIAKGLVMAQEKVLKLVESMGLSVEKDEQPDEVAIDNLTVIEDEINENRIEGLTFLRNLREAYPEIYNAIETRQAIRSVLNHRLNTVEKLLKKGRIESDEAEKMIEHIQEEMKALIDTPPSLKFIMPFKLLRKVPWLKELDDKSFEHILELFEKRIYAVGEDIVKEGKHDDGLYIIVRGSVKVSLGDYVVDVLGAGSVIGEMSVLAGVSRTATVTAESPVTVLRLSSTGMQQVMHDARTIEEKLWEIAGSRFAENYLRSIDPFDKLKHSEFKKWLSEGEIITSEINNKLDFTEGKIGVLLSGMVFKLNQDSVKAPALLKDDVFTLSKKARVFVCGEQAGNA